MKKSKLAPERVSRFSSSSVISVKTNIIAGVLWYCSSSSVWPSTPPNSECKNLQRPCLRLVLRITAGICFEFDIVMKLSGHYYYDLEKY